MAPQRTAGTRTELDILKAQIHAIDAWNRAYKRRGLTARTATLSREQHLDLNRRTEARRRQQAAIVARADAQLRMTGGLLRAHIAPRAIVAHRQAWMTHQLTSLLHDENVHVVGTFTDGADAAGTVVAEQPDLVIVEDRLTTLTGADLVREVRQYSPNSVIAAQALDSGAVPALVHAGAHAVFTRRIPPADIIDHTLAYLRGELESRRALTLV